MATPAPDVTPATLQKIICTYQVAGDTRRQVFYCLPELTTGATNDGTSPWGIFQDAHANWFAVPVTFTSYIVERPDGSSAALPIRTTHGAIAGTMLPSSLAWHLQFHDSRGKTCGHYFHGIVDDANAQNQAAQVGIPPAYQSNLPARISDHMYTATGYKYGAVLNQRLVQRRDKSSGGAGRRLTKLQAERFLWRHGVDAFNNPYKDAADKPLGWDGPFNG